MFMSSEDQIIKIAIWITSKEKIGISVQKNKIETLLSTAFHFRNIVDAINV